MAENTAFSPTSPLTLNTQPTLARHTDYQSQSKQQYSQKSLENLSFILFHFSLFIKTIFQFTSRTRKVFFLIDRLAITIRNRSQ